MKQNLHWIDSHCHLNFKDFETDLGAVIKHAQDNNISEMITIACEMGEMEEVYAIAEKYEHIYASAGVHPHEAEKDLKSYGPETIEETLLTRSRLPKTVGLGETGLDYYYEHSPKKEQIDLFHVHLNVAQKTDLPVIVHTRDAEEETITILKDYKGKVRGVIHCFTGTQWLADQALDLGFYISISGVVTFKKAEVLRDVVKTLPLSRILLETDAPYLAPVPKRGKRNESAFMVHTAEMVANLKGVTLEDLSKQTVQNTLTLFNKIKACGG